MCSDTVARRVLLAVLAHPDDESFGMGGTLALYAQRGVDVYLICATRGEAGMMAPEFLKGFDSAAQRREHELRCAAEKLGLKDVFFLDYRDSGMPGSPDNEHPMALCKAPLEDVSGQIVHFIRTLRPQVVVTFDPIGGYRHPDHIAIHNATVHAFHAAGDPQQFPSDQAPYQPQKLYFHTISRRFLRLAVRAMPLFGKDPRKWGQNQDIDLTTLAAEDFPVHAVIDYRAVRERKMDAATCHASQGGSAMINGLMGWVIRMAGSKETFMQAYPPPRPRTRVRDLFEGIH
ncbi:MAG: GlcNAc-PI de-N-acetylase [Chloroflexi bacterium]|jgi:N-acetyl-1-D-myo-inositol-2-amino-2-deoxy-alpha-D-glucopyranoside deacetylase|nr:GlcNAc-PI de-N-acetylase [Chloroflexota bacterium]